MGLSWFRFKKITGGYCFPKNREVNKDAQLEVQLVAKLEAQQETQLEAKLSKRPLQGDTKLTLGKLPLASALSYAIARHFAPASLSKHIWMLFLSYATI